MQRGSSGIDPAVMKQHEDRAIDVECEPGDVVLFSNLLFHRGDALMRVKCLCGAEYRVQEDIIPARLYGGLWIGDIRYCAKLWLRGTSTWLGDT